MIKFSIIVPLYNCNKFVKECIDSVLAQTYSDFEIVVVNDGSTDNSAEIVRSYKDKRVKIVTKKNGGLFHARLTGLSLAQNDYCLYVDADDKIEKNLLEVLSAEFEQGADCVVYGLKTFGQNIKQTELKACEGRMEFSSSDSREPLIRLLSGKTIQSIVCKAFRKNLVDVEKLNAYPRISVGEDALHTLEVYSKVNKTVFLDGTYYLYRQNQDSMTHKLKFSNYTDNVYKIQKYYETCNNLLDEETRDKALASMPNRYFRMVIALVLNPRYIADKVEFKNVINAISSDDTFIHNYATGLNKCSFKIRILAKMINKRRYRTLRLLRKIIGVFK